MIIYLRIVKVNIGDMYETKKCSDEKIQYLERFDRVTWCGNKKHSGGWPLQVFSHCLTTTVSYMQKKKSDTRKKSMWLSKGWNYQTSYRQSLGFKLGWHLLSFQDRG